MFKKFAPKEEISSQAKTKSSVQRAIRAKLLEQYPALNPYADVILPKKAPMVLIKCKDNISMIMMNDTYLFFQTFDGPYYPTLQLLHKYPDIMPKVQVDKGAIKFVMAGANIMCPGLTSPGASLDAGIPKGTPVAVMAEGKEHAVAIGLMMMSSDEIMKLRKGVGIEPVTYLGDGLYKVCAEAALSALAHAESDSE
ncbi:hypothetical protein CXG81DRAFT_20916 [Caulochytrium protostelioides]|uniref:Translation machinery-associated protein 20 n=1 Tax=Caulochytrium protostelioides TaxID=1555241 RepID=A0A4P9WWD7_9FUNG|nr:hypothetical protein CAUPRSCDRAFT_9798 [Caulochytrium protostelioides]RKO98940.1 hypothetical protein CXG81DRAFT_20916 [Caulochytrium protostelioides]|eukprot:RKO98940.1 hypothetical protein CXG81DRAFT_20916 [Caulochytrium protostelioides]